MPAELTKSLDSKKLKQGDPVTARIAADLRTKDGTAIPRGSRLTGHVTEAKARSKGDPQATLGIAFDTITLPNGKEMAIKGVLQAVAPSSAPSGPVETPGSGMMTAREGAGTGTTPPPAGSLGQASQPSGSVLNPQSKGVLGTRSLQMADNSVLTSSGKEVKLDSGTQMIIQVEIE